MFAGMRWKENSHPLLHGCFLAHALQKTLWRVLSTLRIELPYDGTISLLGLYPQDKRAFVQKDIFTHLFPVAVSTTAKIWNWLRYPPADGQIVKMNTDTMEDYAVARNDEVTQSAATRLGPEDVMLSEINQEDKQDELTYLRCGE